MYKLSQGFIGVAFALLATSAFAASEVRAIAPDVGTTARGSIEAHSGGSPVRAGGASLKAGRGASSVSTNGHTVRSLHMEKFGRA